MIARMGYPSETHTVVTEDCYILEMHRIPHGKGQTKANSKTILLVHGVLGSSADWVMGIPEKSLGYILADGAAGLVTKAWKWPWDAQGYT